VGRGRVSSYSLNLVVVHQGTVTMSPSMACIRQVVVDIPRLLICGKGVPTAGRELTSRIVSNTMILL